ncbi:MAG: peptidase [Nitrosopumilales archaeon CG15_BIG_FIL_POST_REV_8_21_14_020_37_12]|nr:MAG: peptidase [Nitrosopumilales archaeon CG15_BIG_FIL_POST_REV_8_21_14_020_37_12]
MDVISDLFFIRIILAFGMLAIGGFFDVWKREIHDYLWLGFGGAGVALMIVEPHPVEFAFTTLFALMIAPVSLIAWRMGLFGGADAFALIALSVIAPQFTLSENTITPFTTLSNAAVLFVLPLFVNASRNLISVLRNEKIFAGFDEPTWKKVLAIFMGYRSKNPKYGFTMEKQEGSSKKIVLSLHNAETEKFTKKPDTWITPGIPYLLLIIGGFIIQLIYGDIIISAMKIGS